MLIITLSKFAFLNTEIYMRYRAFTALGNTVMYFTYLVHQLSMVILSAIPMSAQMVTQQLQMNGKRHKEAEVLYQITFSFFFSQHNTNETILFSYTNNY